jgi:hypothetical protein
MSIGEGIKRKAAGLAARAVAKAEAAKGANKATDNDKIIDIDKKIAALQAQGGFESTIKRLEAQKAQIKNKLRNEMRK